jgi:hypothetical protein
MLRSVLLLICPDGLALAKIVLVVLISLSTVMTFLAGRRTMGWLAGLGAASFFVVWSPVFQFGKLWHETLLAPLYLLLLLFYDSYAAPHARRTLFFLGLAGGIAMLVKQHAAIVFVAFVTWHAVMNWRALRSFSVVLQDTVVISLAGISPLIVFSVYHVLRAGTLANLLYWTISVNLINGYASAAAKPPTVAQLRALASACLLLPAAILGLTVPTRKDDRTRLHLGWGLLLLAASALTVYPRFEFFHLQPALPVVAWLSSVTLASAFRRRNCHAAWQSRRYLLTAVAVGLSVFWITTSGSAYQSVFREDQPQRVWEYTDLVPLAGEIRQRIGPTDCFYVFPDDEATANLYYLARCWPPNFWVECYPWYMLQPIRSRIVRALQERPPQWIVHFAGRWNIEDLAPEVIAYIQDNYEPDVELHWAQGEVWLLKRVP